MSTLRLMAAKFTEHSLRLIVKFKPLYYLLSPFKFLDKKDLNAAISTFELLLPAAKSKITSR
ncbi:hypothetical protein VBZ67_00660 [Campylobacter concisus]